VSISLGEHALFVTCDGGPLDKVEFGFRSPLRTFDCAAGPVEAPVVLGRYVATDESTTDDRGRERAVYRWQPTPVDDASVDQAGQS
jgi:hypothetical protein